MPNHEAHMTDRELLLAADGELSARRAAEVREHLAACWACRARMHEIDHTIAEFVRAHQDSVAVPPADGPRALLRARLAQAAAGGPSWREKVAAHGERFALGAAAVLLLASLAAVQFWQSTGARLKPDPRLTPGAALPVSEAELCGAPEGASVRFVPAAVGREVFQRYGIGNPAPRAYELDYLIAPELGGAADPRNFWPQPYSATQWNAHVKDALEDHLHKLVCEDKVSLATAQREIADDWISAYKKYFGTQEPIASHRVFTKDDPWE
jgi:hypothetical protein